MHSQLKSGWHFQEASCWQTLTSDLAGTRGAFQLYLESKFGVGGEGILEQAKSDHLSDEAHIGECHNSEDDNNEWKIVELQPPR